MPIGHHSASFAIKSATHAVPLWVLFLAVLSRWLLDVPVHRPDPPLYDDADKIGLGVGNYPVWAFLLEVGLFFACMGMSLRSSGASGVLGRYGMVVFGLTLVAIQAGIVFAPVPRCRPSR